MRVLRSDGAPHVIMEENILYFSSHQNTIYVHTAEGEFVWPISLSELLTAYGPAGYERFDRSNVVNTTQISSYDTGRKAAIFFNAPGCYATVSEPNESKLKKLLKLRNEKGGSL
jgi:DNA-binding LytR/AlgR family response regulator